MIHFLKQTFKEFFDDSCTRLAAALAYFTAFALPPLLYLLLMILGLYYRSTGQGGDETAQAQMNEQITQIAGPAAKQVKEIMSHAGEQAEGNVWQWIISVVGVLIGATGLVAALQDTLNETWEVQPDPEQGGVKAFLLKRVFSLGMILGVAFILLVSTLVSYFVSELVGIGGAVLSALVTFVVVTLLFAAMFKYLPDAIVRWKDVLIGAVVTAILFTLGKFALTEYLSRADFSQFGAAASQAVLIVWVYNTSLIFLYGEEFNHVWA